MAKQFTQEHFDRLKPVKFYWEALGRDGSLSHIAYDHMLLMESVFEEVSGTKLNRSCRECLRDMVQFLRNRYNEFAPAKIEDVALPELKTMPNNNQRREKRNRLKR